MLTENRELVTWVLGGLIVATVVGLALLARWWVTGRTTLDRRQIVLRFGAGLVLLAIWFLMGAMLLSISPVEQTKVFLACFYSCGLLALSLPGFVILDLRYLLVEQIRKESEYSRELVELWLDTTQRPGPAHDS